LIAILCISMQYRLPTKPFSA